MKATHTLQGKPVTRMYIGFVIDTFVIETAIISLLTQKPDFRATKHLVARQIRRMLTSGGADGVADWVSEEDHEKRGEQAETIARALYPSFYNP